MKPTAVATLFGHPRGLAFLVGLKMWELFSYQGMRAFLVFYLIATFALGDAQAAVLFGSYAALVLATSVFGGLIADRWLGPKEPMTAGACLIMTGHLGLALENVLGGLGTFQDSRIFALFCASLGSIAVGTGLLKPNVLNLVGALYRRDDPRRDAGFYAYYIGVNIGSLLAPLVCGYLAAHYGWAYGFAAAAVGMASGLLVLFLGRRHIHDHPESKARRGAVTPRVRLAIYGCVIASIGAAGFLIQHGIVLGIVLLTTLAFGATYLLTAARGTEGATGAAWRLFAVLPVPAMFVMLFEQFGLTINLFADRAVDRDVLGVSFAAPQLISLNGLSVLVILPLLAMMWAALRRTGRDLATTSKFAVGFVLMGAGFCTLSVATAVSSGRIDLGWVLVAYLLITIGELCIAPLTYSLVGRIVPPRLEGVAMGLLQLSFAIGNLSAGLFATLAAVPAGSSDEQIRSIYGNFFALAAVAGAFAAVLCFLLGRVLHARATDLGKQAFEIDLDGGAGAQGPR